jgi:hypothetical protein
MPNIRSQLAERLNRLQKPHLSQAPVEPVEYDFVMHNNAGQNNLERNHSAKARLTTGLAILGGLMVLMAIRPRFGGKNTPSNIKPLGRPKSMHTNILVRGAAIIQDITPVQSLQIYLNGFHYEQGNPDKQMEAHHYCQQVNEDLIQCVLYNGNDKDALLIGVEYVISERLYNGLPEDEKKKWHPHAYAVCSGHVIAPGLPDLAENVLLERFMTTYGKTWYIWDTDEEYLPLGDPKLIMGATRDGQIRPELVDQRDRRFRIASRQRAHFREHLHPTGGHPAWETPGTQEEATQPSR